MSEKVISLKQVTFKYKSSTNFAIRNISLDIEIEDFLLLVGYSGSGKSTLLKTMNGLIPNFYAGTFGGSVKINDENIIDKNPAQLAKQVGFVFQNPENQISNLTVEREIAFPLENFGIPKDEIIARVDEVVELLRLEKIRYKSPFSISGGEQQLTAIAAALALNPQILILDEVTAHLSPNSAKTLLEILSKLNKEHKKTIILSEHRLDRCLDFVNKIAYLEQGKLMKSGSLKEVFSSEEYPENLLPKIPRLFKELANKTDNFEQLTSQYKKSFDTNNLPLTIADFKKMIQIEGEQLD